MKIEHNLGAELRWAHGGLGSGRRAHETEKEIPVGQGVGAVAEGHRKSCADL